MPDYEGEIRRYIIDNLLVGREEKPLSNGDSLLDLGIIDSIGVVDLVNFIQEKYQVELQDDELVPENFESIDGLVRLLSAKKMNVVV